MKMIKGLIAFLYVNILFHGTSGYNDTRMRLETSSIDKQQDRIDNDHKQLKLDLETVKNRIDNFTHVERNSNIQPQITNQRHLLQRLYAAFRHEKDMSRKYMDELTLTKNLVESLKLKYDNNEGKYRSLVSEVDDIKQKLNESKGEVKMALNLQQHNINKLVNSTTQLTEFIKGNRLDDKGCPVDWTLIGNSFYLLNKERFSWDDAQKQCRGKCARLAEFRSEKQFGLIKNALKVCADDYWIGATDKKLEAEWLWDSSGLQVSREGFSNWDEHEPNNAGGMEDCAMTRPTGYWNDAECQLSLKFICEKTFESILTLKCN